MKIVVCIKQVPDSEAKIALQAGRVSWGESPLVINPFDEYAVEAALQLRESPGAEVIAVSMGPESAREALKHALAMGADGAVLVSDPALEELDSQAAARLLAGVIEKIGAVDLVIFGRQSIDSSTGLTTAQTARVLNWPMLALAGSIRIDAAKITVERVMEEGKQTISATMPAVVSVVQGIGEPRYPSFMGIRKAAKAVIPVWGLADLGVDVPAVVVRRVELFSPPARSTECEMISAGTLEEAAGMLADKILAEKVL